MQSQAHSIGYNQLQSKNNGISVQKLISDEFLVCGRVNSVDNKTYPNTKRSIDSERDTAVCPFISGVHMRAQQ